MRIYMQMPAPEGRPPRYCHLLLQPDLIDGWMVVRESGEQGRPGRVRREHFAAWEEAEAALARMRDAQLRRGYRVVFVEGQQGGAP